MRNTIALLPDYISNQIAAGEVVQRPSSVVKELIENAVDAGSKKITLNVKDSGLTLIEVSDDGKGMGETDARLCFERHATSKIKHADDLFKLTSKGFRGEALASIAAIAQVELKTKLENEDLGVKIKVEANRVISQEPVGCSNGSTFSVRNIFYNVPARRNFLKSDNVEFRHIYDEFIRVALIHNEISFVLNHNNKETVNLPKKSFKERIVNIFGKKYNHNFIPLIEDANFLKIDGFIGKPEAAKKTRKEQFFFVNNRYIKSPYLNHAIITAYKEMIPKEAYPSYFIRFTVDPSTIDINIHPTKTEIKFDDERAVYAILIATVKRALGKYNISPVLEFDKEDFFDIPSIKKNQKVSVPTITVDENYNPFDNNQTRRSKGGKKLKKLEPNKDWESLYETFNLEIKPDKELQKEIFDETETLNNSSVFFQYQNAYIITYIKTGLVIINQSRAHQKILYEQYIKDFKKENFVSQKVMYPVLIDIPHNQIESTKLLLEAFSTLGFDMELKTVESQLQVNSYPDIISEKNVSETVQEILLEIEKNDGFDIKQISLYIIKVISKLKAKDNKMESGTSLAKKEISDLISRLFALENPFYIDNGKAIFIKISNQEILNKFK